MAKRDKEPKEYLLHRSGIAWVPELVEVGDNFWLVKMVNGAHGFSSLNCYSVSVIGFEKDANCELYVSLLSEPYANPGEAVMLKVEARDEESVRTAQKPLTLGLRVQGDHMCTQGASWVYVSLPPLKGGRLG